MQIPLVKGNYGREKAESGKRKAETRAIRGAERGPTARLGQKNGGQKNADRARGRNQQR